MFDNLEKLAKAANHSKVWWTPTDLRLFRMMGDLTKGLPFHDQDREFIAEASPEMVLKLVGRIRELEESNVI